MLFTDVRCFNNIETINANNSRPSKMLFSQNCLDITMLSNLVADSINNEEQLHLISNIIDDIEAVMCAKDTEGRHFIANRCYERSVGIDRENVFGKTDEEIFSFSPETAKEIREKDLKVMRTKKKNAFEEKVPCSNGEIKYYLTMKSPILNSNGTCVGLMCLAVDISKQKMLEQKLLGATMAKNLFLAKMSHEIRTPISAVAGYIDLINHSDPSMHKKYLNNISTSVEHLLNLVNDILDISSIEENKIHLDHKKFNLLEILESVISTLKFKANICKIKVITKIKPGQSNHFVGDETRVKQIILNLVSNAVKFSSGKPIEVRISINHSRYDGKKKISIIVKDQGIGLNTSNRERIYHAFSQLRSSEHYFEGTGLGLAIVKELSQLMNGSVKFFSEEGHGTLVATAIHLEESYRASQQIPKFTMYDSSGSKLLRNKIICIAEDQTFNREILKSMAQSEGAEVIAFADGEHLIKAVKSNSLPPSIDCFLIDIHMPIMSGVEALTLLREFTEYKNTPAYFVTADAVQDNLDRYWSNNYNLSGIYLKPLKRQELINCVNGNIEIASTEGTN